MWYLLWFVGILLDVFALHPCVGTWLDPRLKVNERRPDAAH